MIHPLKTSENKIFSILLSGIAMHHWDDMGYGIIAKFHMHNQVTWER